MELCPGRSIGPGHDPFVIAEIGQNHQGSVETAKMMILAAKKCGADCVKFQKSCLEEKFTTAALDRPYNSPNAFGDGNTYGSHKRHLEFTEDEFRELQAYAKEIGIWFTASAMDQRSAEFLDALNVPFLKIGSGDVNNWKLLRQVSKLSRPLVVSTGMADIQWVRTMVKLLKMGTDNFVLLQCTSSYPTPAEHVNLRVMDSYRKEFPETLIGYSGHEHGIKISLMAARMGACVIERHFTLDKHQKGSDHICSLEPSELEQLVYHIKSKSDLPTIRELSDVITAEDLEAAEGDGIKKFETSEMPCYEKLGKTIVAAEDLPKGAFITENKIKIKVAEPSGIDPRYFDQYLGLQLKEPVAKDVSITSDKLEPLHLHFTVQAERTCFDFVPDPDEKLLDTDEPAEGALDVADSKEAMTVGSSSDTSIGCDKEPIVCET